MSNSEKKKEELIEEIKLLHKQLEKKDEELKKLDSLKSNFLTLLSLLIHSHP